jgi:hypothetical protein
MITLKQYDELLKVCRHAAATSKVGSYFVMTDSLFNEIKAVCDVITDDTEIRYYYFLGLRIEVLETALPVYRWWIVAPGKGGGLN